VNAAAIERASLDFNGQTLDVAAALAKVQASVVSIETAVRVRQGPFVQQGSGAGTGVVLDGNGDILTNAHVVANASSVQVTVPGESTARDATVVASNTEQDIAVVHVDDASGLTPATFGNSDAVQVGDQVIAVGNALALEGGFTVTEGIVSALDRTIQTDASSSLAHLIQTDAAISSGNSGGALVDARGEVIGINTAVASSSNTVQASNIGFAISINTARVEAEALLAQRS
jgi:putative serine protease PepD